MSDKETLESIARTVDQIEKNIDKIRDDQNEMKVEINSLHRSFSDSKTQWEGKINTTYNVAIANVFFVGAAAVGLFFAVYFTENTSKVAAIDAIPLDREAVAHAIEPAAAPPGFNPILDYDESLHDLKNTLDMLVNSLDSKKKIDVQPTSDNDQ